MGGGSTHPDAKKKKTIFTFVTLMTFILNNIPERYEIWDFYGDEDSYCCLLSNDISTLKMETCTIKMFAAAHQTTRYHKAEDDNMYEYQNDFNPDISFRAWRSSGIVSKVLNLNECSFIQRQQVGTSRSQWPRGLSHEPSSPARTLGSWVRIPLKAWMSACIYSVFVLFCV
jgi:hypothetical protein